MTTRSKAMPGSAPSSSAWAACRPSSEATPAGKGSELPPHKGTNVQGTWNQLPPDHPDGWTCVAPSPIPSGGGGHICPVKELSVADIKALHQSYADAAKRALQAGYKWLEMPDADGYLGASFCFPLANQRTDAYGGSVENRARFHLEALDAVRVVWPERYPLTMRLGSDDLHPDGAQFEDYLLAIAMMKATGSISPTCRSASTPNR